MELIDAIRHTEEPRTEYFIEIPHPVGKLRLDLLGPVSAALTQPGSTPDTMVAAGGAIRTAITKGQAGDQAGELATLIDAMKEYPYETQLYGAIYDVYSAQENLTEAEYYMKQAIAVDPNYRNLSFLGRTLGRQGKLEEAAAIQDYLWQTRAQADKTEALSAVQDYLVTLGRLQKPREMIDITMKAMQEFGSETTLVYQYIFALTLDNQEDVARTQLERIYSQLNPEDSLYARFQQLHTYLNRPKVGELH